MRTPHSCSTFFYCLQFVVKPKGLLLGVRPGKLSCGQLNTEPETPQNAPHMIGVVSNPKQLLDQVSCKRCCPNTRVQTCALRPLFYDTIKLCKLLLRQFRLSTRIRSLHERFETASPVPRDPVLQGSPADSHNLSSSAFPHSFTHQQQTLNALGHIGVFAPSGHLVRLPQPIHDSLAQP